MISSPTDEQRRSKVKVMLIDGNGSPPTSPAIRYTTTAACSATVTRPVTPGHSACRGTGNRANSGDVEAEGWRMAVDLKTTVLGRYPQPGPSATTGQAWAGGRWRVRAPAPPRRAPSGRCAWPARGPARGAPD